MNPNNVLEALTLLETSPPQPISTQLIRLFTLFQDVPAIVSKAFSVISLWQYQDQKFSYELFNILPLSFFHEYLRGQNILYVCSSLIIISNFVNDGGKMSTQLYNEYSAELFQLLHCSVEQVQINAALVFTNLLMAKPFVGMDIAKTAVAVCVEAIASKSELLITNSLIALRNFSCNKDPQVDSVMSTNAMGIWEKFVLVPKDVFDKNLATVAVILSNSLMSNSTTLMNKILETNIVETIASLVRTNDDMMCKNGLFFFENFIVDNNREVSFNLCERVSRLGIAEIANEVVAKQIRSLATVGEAMRFWVNYFDLCSIERIRPFYNNQMFIDALKRIMDVTDVRMVVKVMLIVRRICVDYQQSGVSVQDFLDGNSLTDTIVMFTTQSESTKLRNVAINITKMYNDDSEF
ncbi:hypothetical protein EIN_335200 [Entamoeba invadens IP1]|uniref:Uncharacterized protein n=1 Tax=Entamoeba invadens IP1 TaxID=370355 RepID=L7FLA8_ENTIV|nr:hypothetical protein EIN_335200 [Entamoeba invadens IP1]ELP88548.1 hypothetical protein EIN_335200 [Entamoeba invadens IP1]|eukprot:XP_004255319.1 hypothetical protein EIN_335200 [Entamoeba invadens IP1]